MILSSESCGLAVAVTALAEDAEKRRRRLATVLLVLCTSALAAVGARGQSADACGSLANGYGPFDYRYDHDKLAIVNLHHFTPQVQALLKGEEGYLGGDLDYVLRAFPNHYPALLTVVKYGEKLHSPQPAELPRPIECYFERAIRFKGDDALVKTIYAKFLFGQKRTEDAMRQLAYATTLAGDDPLTLQNVGLTYVDMKQYAQARTVTQKILATGATPRLLVDALKKAGEWNDSMTAAASAASAAE